ncbi:hypothetical protein ES703_87111 [subsurface metagenome]
MSFGPNPIPGQLHLDRAAGGAFGNRHVDRHINQHRTRPTGRSNIKCLPNGTGHVLNVLDNAVVFCNRTGDAGSVSFLKCVISDKLRANLSRQGNHRHRVHHCRSKTGNQIARTRAAGRDHNADFSTGTRIGISHMAAALLVTRNYKINRRIV